MINKIFEKENRYYNFYIGLPMLLWLELLVCYFLMPNDSLVRGLLFLFGVICSITSIVLGLVHYQILVAFRKQFNNLTEEQKFSLKEHAIKKIWRVYLSKDVLIQYGMFTKQIILVEDILSVQRNKGIRTMNAGVYTISEEVDEMILTMKNGKSTVVETSDELIEAMDCLLAGNAVKKTLAEKINSVSDKPIEGITALAVLGSIVFFMGGYSRFMQIFVRTKTAIEKLLFLVGYESYFWFGAVILMSICVLGVFIWRAFARRGKKYNTAMWIIWGSIVILSMMCVYVEYDNKFNEYSYDARADYRLYQEGLYEQIIVNDIKAIDDPYEAWGEWTFYEQIEKLEIQLDFIKIKTDEEIKFKEEYFPEFILLDYDSSLWEENRYKVQYLKNTGIVVDIEEL